MPTEAMTRHGYGAGPVEPAVARSDQLHHGLRYDGDGYFRPQGRPRRANSPRRCPRHRRDLRELVDLAICSLHEIEQPGANDGAVLPTVENIGDGAPFVVTLQQVTPSAIACSIPNSTPLWASLRSALHPVRLRRHSRHVEHVDPAILDRFAKLPQAPHVGQARLHELDGDASLIESHDAHLHAQCTKCNAAAHLVETNNAESVVTGLIHGRCLSWSRSKLASCNVLRNGLG